MLFLLKINYKLTTRHKTRRVYVLFYKINLQTFFIRDGAMTLSCQRDFDYVNFVLFIARH